MTDYKKFFKGRKITIMGLGILGRGIGYTKFLAECGASLTVTDLKSAEMLKPSLSKLRQFKNIKFVLGKHRLEDFKGRDMVIKAAGVPMDSVYINEARKHNIPVEMDVSLFIKCAPFVTVVGVTGTRGKSMTTMLIYEILKGNEKLLGGKVYLGGNVRGVATLPLLGKVKEGDILVCELDSWQLQGFGDSKISPHISVFTSFMPDHMNYYKNNLKNYFNDKANIFKYQKKDDVLIVRQAVKKLIPKIKSKLVVAKKDDVKDWKFVVPGEHQRENLACAVSVAKEFNIPISKIKNIVKDFKGVEGRMEYIGAIDGVKIYNDNNATTPEAAVAGITALSGKNNLILIAGGSDKGLDLSGLVKSVNKNCSALVLLEGTGTENLISHKIKPTTVLVSNLKDAVNQALSFAKKGDVVLFSPAFASFGMFNNEYERNDKFVKIIKKLK